MAKRKPFPTDPGAGYARCADMLNEFQLNWGRQHTDDWNKGFAAAVHVLRRRAQRERGRKQIKTVPDFWAQHSERRDGR